MVGRPRNKARLVVCCAIALQGKKYLIVCTYECKEKNLKDWSSVVTDVVNVVTISELQPPTLTAISMHAVSKLLCFVCTGAPIVLECTCSLTD